MNVDEAKRLALMVHRDPCKAVRRSVLEQRMGLREQALKTALFIAYRKRWIDFIQDYVVAADARWVSGPGRPPQDGHQPATPTA